MAPKLGLENRKSFLVNQKSPFITNNEYKQARGSKVTSPEKVADCKKSVKSVSSENASTICSKSAISKRVQSKAGKPPIISKSNKIHNIKKIGVGNDNFLTSFISHRGKEKKGKNICEKSRMYGFNIEEPWFQEILGMSIESELDEGE